MKLLLTLLSFTIIFQTFSQKENPTEWQTSVSKTEVKAGEVIELIFTADIKDGWYVYSSDFDPDLGPVVATFDFAENDSYQLVGKIQPVGAKSKEDTEIWMGTYTYFSKKAEFRQKVKILKDNPVIKVKLNAQACTEVDGKCIPIIKQFQFAGIKVKQGSSGTGTGSSEKKKPDTTETQKDVKASASVKDPDLLSLKELQEEKQKLIKTGKNGEDQVIAELEDFVKKYGGM